jgi:hypothetical protein
MEEYVLLTGASSGVSQSAKVVFNSVLLNKKIWEVKKEKQGIG